MTGGLDARLASIEDVAERQLCAGCGACAVAQPGTIRMVDDLTTGRRPLVAAGASTQQALEACPGVRLEHDRAAWDEGWDAELADEWGPVLAVWEGYATDPEIRFRGSSGGAATALALWSLERSSAGSVVHSGARPGAPEFNDAVQSRDRDQLLAHTGSRYAPASPCEGLATASGPLAFVGKPCDVAGARMLDERGLLPEGAEVDLTVAIFCAGAPSTAATLGYLADTWGQEPGALDELRFRGHGWPGSFVARAQDGSTHEASYAASWGVIQAGRPWRCRICPDHTGEFADVSVGDPWHTPPQPREHGRSLVVARTARGLGAVERAIEDGYLELERVDASLLPASQAELQRTRRTVQGRLLAMRLAGLPVPRFRGMALLGTWLRTPPGNLLRSVLGTLRRLGRYGLRRRRPVVEFEPSRRAPTAGGGS